MGFSTRSRSSCLAASLVAVALFSLGAAPARADPAEEQARAEFKKGKTAYDLGRFDEALKAYTDAYEHKPLPAFLFNIAQCHKQMGSFERAVFFYRRYLDQVTSPKDAQTVTKLIDECAAKAAEQQRRKDEEAARLRKQQEDDEREKARQAALAVPPPPVGGLASSSQLPGDAVEKPPVYKTWWFWTAVGVAAAVAAGTATGVALVKPQPTYTSLGTISAR